MPTEKDAYYAHMEKSIHDSLQEEFLGEALKKILEERNYPRYYAMLRRLDEPVPLNACIAALDCTYRAFIRTLDHSCLDQRQMQILAYHAAKSNRPEHLKLLLERGATPDDQGNCSMASPLEGAVEGRSLRCVDLLLEHLGEEPRFTHDLLLQWTMAENGDTMLDFCLQSIAQKWMPEQYNFLAPLPVPPGLELDWVLWAGNWHLAERMFRELPEGKEVFRKLILFWSDLLTQPDFFPVAAAVLKQYPDLLEDQDVTEWLALAILLPEDGAPAALLPFLEILHQREYIALNGIFHTLYMGVLKAPGWQVLLERWERRLGKGLQPVLDRRFNLPRCQSADEMKAILERCTAVGEFPADGASSMARYLVQHSPAVLRAALAPGGILEGEDLRQLRETIPSGADATAEDRAKRAILLAHIR